MDLDSKRALRTTVVTVATTALLTGGAASAAAAGREKPPAADPDAQQAAPRPAERGRAGAGRRRSPGRMRCPAAAARGAAAGAADRTDARPSERPPRPSCGRGRRHATDALPGGHAAAVRGGIRVRRARRAWRPAAEAVRPRAAEAGRERPGAAADRDGPAEVEGLGPTASARPEYARGSGRRPPGGRRTRAGRTAPRTRGRRLAAGFARRGPAGARPPRRARHARRARARAGRPRGEELRLPPGPPAPGGRAQFRCLDRLWTRESNWNHRAVTPLGRLRHPAGAARAQDAGVRARLAAPTRSPRCAGACGTSSRGTARPARPGPTSSARNWY